MIPETTSLVGAAWSICLITEAVMLMGTRYDGEWGMARACERSSKARGWIYAIYFKMIKE